MTSSRARTPGSTYLRGHQLSAIVNAALAETISAVCTAGLGDVSGSLVILDKYAVEAASARDVESARSRGNRVIADPVDGPFEPDVLNRFDGVIAAARSQARHYQAMLAVPVAYVGHHVDLRIRPAPVPQQHLSPYYFGELAHARHRQELEGLVTFVSVNTKDAHDVSWMERLREANAHYALRPPERRHVHKPFTKGFIAARCGVPVIADRNDPEAGEFLPDDYPYWAQGDDLAGIKEVLARMAGEFTRAPWQKALQDMKWLEQSCSVSVVVRDVLSAVARFG